MTANNTLHVDPPRRIREAAVCGVAGILRFDGAPAALESLLAMSRALSHRGPDGYGIERFEPCGLVHRRLSILDLSPAGKQPMSTPDGRVWLTYNGEVYNYLELREELQKLGHTFTTGTDSEVILAAYRVWGEDAFPRFNGMWALALWDQDKKKLVLSRDRMGVKPLYLHRNGRRLIFASEVKALLAADPELARASIRTIARFIERPSHVYGRDSFFEGVERLEPGTVLSLYTNGRSRIHRYWTFLPPRIPRRIKLSTAADEVRNLLIDSVRLRFRSDVPVGTCLSGGLDSSSIVAIAGKCLGKAPESFSALYQQEEHSETKWVHLMARELGLTAHEVTPTGDDLPEVLERATYYQEQPTGGPGVYSQWHVMRIAQPRVKVLLDGQGGDEIFGGYFAYFVPWARSLFDRGVRGDSSAVWSLLKGRGKIASLSGTDPLAELMKHGKNKVFRKLGIKSGQPSTTTHQPLAPALRALLDDERSTWPTPVLNGDALTDTLWDQLIRTSIPGLLHFEDRDSMAFSIEARVPFLDYRLIELAFSLPNELKIDGDRTKVVLREAMKGLLPEPIRERRDKKGYPTPFAEWIRQKHAGWMHDVLLSTSARDRGYTDPKAVEALIKEHVDGKDHAWRLYQLLTLELFSRRYFDGTFHAEPPPPYAMKERETPPQPSQGAAETR